MNGYLDPKALLESGLRLYRSGGFKRGASTGWPSVDELYTVAPGQWTVVTGIPQSGKSEWLDALLVNLAEGGEWRFAVFSPENWPPETHLAKLTEKRARMPFTPGPTERMSERIYTEAASWVVEHFAWLNPERKTPESLLAQALAYKPGPSRHYGVVLDPWNTLDHLRGNLNETDYVSSILTFVTELARESHAHVWLVVHPHKLLRNKDGTRPVPTPYDISGSAHWYNKADNIITVHRDQVDGSQDVQIYVQKVRFKHIGHIGLAELKWDKVTGRYFEGPTGFRDVTGRKEQYADPQRFGGS